MLEFVTKTPKAAKAATFFQDILKVNTANGNINLSPSVVIALKDGTPVEHEDLFVGMAFDADKKEAYIFSALEGLKASGKKQSTVRSTYLTDKVVSTFNLEEHAGKVLVLEVNLKEPVNHETDNGTLALFKAEFKEATLPRGSKKAEAAPKHDPVEVPYEELTEEPAPQADADQEFIPQDGVSYPAPGMTAAPQEAPTFPEETTEAEEEGLQAKDVSDVVGDVPPSAPAPGAMEWPSDN